jgi:hypothetical protein
MQTQTVLDYYREPGPMTMPGKHAGALSALPGDVHALARIVQGLAVHQYAAAHYDVTLTDERTSESHIRQVDRLLDRVFEIDPKPLTIARPASKRVVGVCHHFMLLMTAMLRAQGIPARGRCGFGSYFNPGYFEDHWVCEYWNTARQRWMLADAQLDENWRREGRIEFDVLDVPRDRFIVAADAWTRCRSGRADASRYGIFLNEMRGLWFIAGNLIRDAAALCKVEMLPWDVWGGIPGVAEQLDEAELAFFDRLAGLLSEGDGALSEVQQRFECDERLRIPERVFNAIRRSMEDV